VRGTKERFQCFFQKKGSEGDGEWNETPNADEALDVLAHISGVSLIISDIRMPGFIDGLGLARAATPLF